MTERSLHYTSWAGSYDRASYDVVEKNGQLRAVGEYHHVKLRTSRKFNVKIHENGRFVVAIGASRRNIHFYLPPTYFPPRSKPPRTEFIGHDCDDGYLETLKTVPAVAPKRDWLKVLLKVALGRR